MDTEIVLYTGFHQYRLISPELLMKIEVELPYKQKL